MKHRFFILVACIMTCLTMAAQDVSKLSDLYDKQQYSEVVQQCTQQLQRYPKEGILYWYRALGYEQQEEYGRALQDADMAIKYIKSIGKKYPSIDKSGVYRLRADLYWTIGDTIKALADCNMAIKTNSKAAANYASRALFYQEQNQYDKAIADYSTAAKLEPTNEDWQELIARCYLLRGDKELAYSKYSILAKLYPNNCDIWYYWSWCNKFHGDNETFIDAYIHYINIYYTQYGVPNTELLYSLGSTDMYAYLLRAVNNEIKSSEDDLQSFWKGVRVKVYMEKGNYKDAISELNTLDQTTPFVLYYRAECYMSLYQFRNAITDYSEYITAHPDYADVYCNRGVCYEESGQFDKAITDFTYVIENFPAYAYFAYYRRGWVYEFQQDTIAAMSDYNKSIELEPDYAYTYLMRGTLYLRQGDTAKANADFEHILAVDTIVREGSCRQYALLHLGQENAAVAWVQEILALNTEYAGHYYDLACVYSLLNRTDEALDALDMAFKKGYRSFVHIEYDDDMNNIRNLPRFTEILNKYRQEGVMQKFRTLGGK